MKDFRLHNGLYHVPVELVQDTLTDHYDPLSRTVRLSEPVYYGRSLVAVSVAAHEVDHAIQHQQSYRALVLRHRMFPVVNFSSGIALFLLLGGLLLHQTSLIGLGIILFSAAAFQVITLPIELNASSRAKLLLVVE
jgi:Zn-dependent membrane protease YugP